MLVMKEKFFLKDALFNRSKVEKIAFEIKDVYPAFNERLFVKDVLACFSSLELKDRMYHIRHMLAKYLPPVYEEAVTILLKALPPALDTQKTDNDFGDFIYAAYADFVSFYGCTKKDVLFSLAALQKITKRFSVEFAIRDFVNSFPKETLEMLYNCSLSENYHERRLSSEGLRPALPWAKKLTIDYHEPLFILDNLFCDNTRYVVRSVANHLNDISKKDAPLVLSLLKRWKKSKKQTPAQMQYLINHALRTLVKQGNKEALSFLGYQPNPAINISKFKLFFQTVHIGDTLFFELNIEALKEVKLMIDYIIYFQTKSGKLRPKVYKFKRLVLQKNESMTLQKKHLFKTHMSTRTLYEGEHTLEIQINAHIVQSTSFLLKKRV